MSLSQDDIGRSSGSSTECRKGGGKEKELAFHSFSFQVLTPVEAGILAFI